MDATNVGGGPGSEQPGSVSIRRVTPAPPPPQDFRIGEWLVQPTLGRLSRGKTIVRLRRQLMDVLVCLASGNGRTVMKLDILDAVWSDRFVTETALARSVAELRLALGDDARRPRIIETIPKRGYRIMAPIAAAEDVPAARVEPAAPSAAGRDESSDAAVWWALMAGVLAAIGTALLLVG